MVTKPKGLDEIKRPWRVASASLRNAVSCPLCRKYQPRVVAYRKNTVRLECETCGLRFSVRPLDIANTLRMRAEEVFAALGDWEQQRLVMGLLVSGGTWEADAPDANEQLKTAILTMLRQEGTMIAVGVLAKPNDTPEERAHRLNQLRPEQPEVT
jgi:hypothetical protein